MKRKTQNAKRKTTMQKSKVFSFYLWFCLLPFYFLLFLSGCATVLEGAKGVAGISTKALEESRKDAVTKTFNYDYNTCYTKVKAAIKETGSYIYAQDKNKHMIAVYVSDEDATALGIFFKEIDANNTEIQVTSASTYAKDTVSKDVFSVLEGTYKPKDEKGQPDDKKEMGY